MSAPAPPAPSLHPPVAPGDGLGIADLLDLLGLESSEPGDTDLRDADLRDTDLRDTDPAAALRPADAVAVVRGWVRRAAGWGSGPQRSWCAW